MPTVKAYIGQVNLGAQPAGPQLPLDSPAIRARSQVAQTLGDVSNAAFARADQWQKQKDQLEVEAYKSEISDIVRKKRQEIVEREGRNAEGSTKEMEGLFAETAKSYEGKLKNSNQQQLFTSYVTAARDVGVDFAARHESQQRQVWKGEIREAATVRAMSDAEAYPGSLPKILEDLEGSLGNLFSGHVKESYWEPARSKVIMSAVSSLTAQKRFAEAQGLVERYREFLSGSDEVSASRTIKSLSEEHEVETILNRFYLDPEGAAADASRLDGYLRARVESQIETLQESKKQDEEKKRREAARAEKQAVASAVIGGDMVAADKAIQQAIQSGNMDGEDLIQFDNYRKQYQAGQIKQATEKAKQEAVIAVYTGEIKDVTDLVRYGVHPDEWKGLLDLADKQTGNSKMGLRNTYEAAEKWFDAQVKTKKGDSQAELAATKQDFMLDLIAVAEKEGLSEDDPGILTWAKKLYEEGSYVLEERPGWLTRNVRGDRLADVFRYRRERNLSIDDLIKQYRPDMPNAYDITPGVTLEGVQPDLLGLLDEVLAEHPEVKLTLTSGFRTYEKQADLRSRAGEPGIMMPAAPGTSPHEFGRAFDFKVTKGATQKQVHDWLTEKAAAKGLTPAPFLTGDPVHFGVRPAAAEPKPETVGYEALNEVYGLERVKQVIATLQGAGKLITPETVKAVADMAFGEGKPPEPANDDYDLYR